jgi:hypothetical protein
MVVVSDSAKWRSGWVARTEFAGMNVNDVDYPGGEAQLAAAGGRLRDILSFAPIQRLLE